MTVNASILASFKVTSHSVASDVTLYGEGRQDRRLMSIAHILAPYKFMHKRISYFRLLCPDVDEVTAPGAVFSLQNSRPCDVRDDLCLDWLRRQFAPDGLR